MAHDDATSQRELELARSLLASGRPQEARAACLQLLRRAPECTGAMLLLGRLEADAGHLNIAERLLRRAFALEPSRAAHAHALGSLLAQRDQHAEALRLLTHALELDPASADAWLARGRLHQALRHLPEAESDLRAAIRCAPDRPYALDALGVFLADLHRGDEAVSCFEHAIRAQTTYARALDHLGAVHLARGRIAQAMRCFENAAHYDPRLASAHDHLGLALLGRDAPPAPGAHHERAHELAPIQLLAAHRARAAASLGRRAEAEAGFRAALAREPDSSMRWPDSALMCARGEYQRGLELVEARAAAGRAARQSASCARAC